ncbi:hypothetical protein [Rubrobacter indicoceani]|uniref:hypothetical protein n=1 Tax=Rubrobacter indicoceani TaxID=2051957 RepID=UPI000E5C1C11|nr:hypothetical protein [Rubrobacter indicoceani]
MENDQDLTGGEGGIEALEQRVVELERIAETLADTPDGEVVEALDHALGLLKEINSTVQASLDSVSGEARELGDILDGLSFGSFDEALADLERRERGTDDDAS